jgi:hypothetical protein
MTAVELAKALFKTYWTASSLEGQSQWEQARWLAVAEKAIALIQRSK